MRVLRVPDWDGIPGLVHGFLGRSGGCSRGGYSSLNLSAHVGDDPDRVERNWRRVRNAWPALEFVRARQVHGTRIAPVPARDAEPPEADGLASARPGLVLGILTADCVPILMVAPERRAAAAVHAGRRGTIDGIARAAVEAMRRHFGVQPRQLLVAMGPAIGGCCYEVDAAIGRRFVRRLGSIDGMWAPAVRRGKLDLRAANRAILLEAGVVERNVTAVGPCTVCKRQRFFSHRASGGSTGRQLSFIGFRRR